MYWLVHCCKKLVHAYYHMGGPALKKHWVSSIAFLCRVFMFDTGREKFFMQSEFISSRLITQIVTLSNEAGDSTAGT